MQKFLIRGGRQLSGSIKVSGSKNASLPILAASLLFNGTVIIHGVPRLCDVEVMREVMIHLGAKVSWLGNSSIKIDSSGIEKLEVPENLMRKMRASNLVLGSLIGRFRRAKISFPGGCNIGSRPMDLHLRGLSAMGTSIKEKTGYIIAAAPSLAGADIHLDFPSVGATENLMMASVLAGGRTAIFNAAKEPEIVDLQNFLNSMGAKVQGAGTDIIRVQGVTELHPTEYTIIPDRIEAGTHLIAAAITGSEITVENVIPEHLDPVIAKLREAGVEILTGEDFIQVKKGGRPKPVNIKTLPFPGFPTDMQPQFMAFLSLAEGVSIITETIFENRFKHVGELMRMGANIRVEGRVAVIKGVKSLNGAHVEATDLRAGAALVLAGLAAEETTVVDSIYHIDRGYEKLEEKYKGLGADIERVISR